MLEGRWTAWKAQTFEQKYQQFGEGFSGETVMSLVLEILEKLKTGPWQWPWEGMAAARGMRTNKEQVPSPTSSLALFHSQGDTGKAGTRSQGAAPAPECGEAGL